MLKIRSLLFRTGEYQDVRRKQLEVCNPFPFVSSLVGAFMHSLNGR